MHLKEARLRTDLVTIPPFVSQTVESVGIEFEDLMRRIGVPASRRNERLALTTDQFFALWNALAAAGVPPDFGLQLPLRAPSHQFDVASTAALMSENLGEALARLARYKRLTCPEDIEVGVEDEEVRVRFLWLCASSSVPHFVTDSAFSWLCCLIAIGTEGRIKPLRVELTRTESNRDLLGRHFGCAVRFNAPRDILVFQKDALGARFASHHPQMLALMLPGLEEALMEKSSAVTLARRVRNVLLKSMHGRRPSVDLVARELCLSPRTLQRRLEEEGTSYQRLLDGVRQETARHLLASTNLDTGEIAFVLGFEELNSFARAFQSWEGTSPNRWRMSQGQGAGQRPIQ